MNDKATTPASPDLAGLASMRIRLVSMLYESILLIALLMLAAFAYLPILGIPHSPFQKAVFQLYLVVVLMAYFVLLWRKSGQTLPMKTWRIVLLTEENRVPDTGRCVLRFAWALVGVVGFGVGLLWALLDRDRQFLHDRLAGTRLHRQR